MVKQPVLSIVITSYTTGRLKSVFELLDSIKNQTYPKIETIFVAEGSKELYERVKAYAEESSIPNIKVVFNRKERGLSASRNLGIEHAEGDILGFVDDDVLLFPDWAQEMIKTYQDDSVIGVTSATLPLWEDESMSWLPREFYWILSCSDWCGLRKTTEVRNAWGHSMSFRREAFDLVGNFLTTTGFSHGTSLVLSPIGEDIEFSIRARMKTGKRIVYNPNGKVWHRVYRQRSSLSYFVKRAYWIGRSRHMLRQFYNEDHGNMDMFASERRLLKRILTSFLPEALKDISVRPLMAWRKLSIASMVLLFVALGYFNVNLVKSDTALNSTI